MNAELTKISGLSEIQGWILYDGECSICRAWAARIEDMFTKRGFDFAPLQAPWVGECLGVKDTELLTEMRVVTSAGKTFGGADAVIELARHVWWAWPLSVFARLPGAKRLLRAGYQWLARNRHCLGGACQVPVGDHRAPSHVTALRGGTP